MSQSNEAYTNEEIPSIASETVEDNTVVSEEPEEARELSPADAVNRYAQAEEESPIDEDEEAATAPPAAEEDKEESKPPQPTAKKSAKKPNSSDDDDDDDAGADAENERLFNMYQERLDSKPLGSARRTAQRPASGTTSARAANVVPPLSPHPDVYARRGSSGLVRGNSYQGSPRQSVAASEGAVAFRRRASVLTSARYNAARASLGGTSQYCADRRRSSTAMTEGERMALEKMEESEARRNEAKARAELIQAYREEDVVQMELEKEVAANDRLVERLHTKEKARVDKMRANWERQEQARLRREAQERDRKAHLEARIEATKDVPVDPFKMMMVKRRYSANVQRSDQPVTPHRRITAGRRASQVDDEARRDSPVESQNASQMNSARGEQNQNPQQPQPQQATSGTPRSRRSSVQEARDMWRAPAGDAKAKAWR